MNIAAAIGQFEYFVKSLQKENFNPNAGTDVNLVPTYYDELGNLIRRYFVLDADQKYFLKRLDSLKTRNAGYNNITKLDGINKFTVNIIKELEGRALDSLKKGWNKSIAATNTVHQTPTNDNTNKLVPIIDKKKNSLKG